MSHKRDKLTPEKPAFASISCYFLSQSHHPVSRVLLCSRPWVLPALSFCLCLQVHWFYGIIQWVLSVPIPPLYSSGTFLLRSTWLPPALEQQHPWPCRIQGRGYLMTNPFVLLNASSIWMNWLRLVSPEADTDGRIPMQITCKNTLPREPGGEVKPGKHEQEERLRGCKSGQVFKPYLAGNHIKGCSRARPNSIEGARRCLTLLSPGLKPTPGEMPFSGLYLQAEPSASQSVVSCGAGQQPKPSAWWNWWGS